MLLYSYSNTDEWLAIKQNCVWKQHKKQTEMKKIENKTRDTGNHPNMFADKGEFPNLWHRHAEVFIIPISAFFFQKDIFLLFEQKSIRINELLRNFKTSDL